MNLSGAIGGFYGLEGPCSCEEGQCLQISCHCLTNGRTCNGCFCKNCRNLRGNEKEIAEASKKFIYSGGSATSNVVIPRKPCGCTRNCLNRQCVCFKNDYRCLEECRCGKACENTPQKEGDGTVGKVKDKILKTRANAFEPTVSASETSGFKHKGCTCTTVRCAGNRCPCFSLGIMCTSDCKCLRDDCENK